MSINVCNDRSMASITSLPSGVSGSSLVLISTTTASSSSTVDITSGINSTYKEYQVHFIDVHGSADDESLQFNMTTDGTNFNVSKTTTYFVAYHNEAGNDTSLQYETSRDLAQGTGFQILNDRLGTDNDQCVSGVLHLFDPSNTTFVKHFMSRSTSQFDRVTDVYCAGYFNTTSAINAMQFKFDSGNTDAGVIKLYGIS